MIRIGWIYREGDWFKASLNYLPDANGWIKQDEPIKHSRSDAADILTWVEDQLKGRVVLEQTPMGFRIVEVKRG